jgi:hypothetical protein
MSKKTDRAAHGPSWTEVILGALLSLILGVIIGAALLVLRPAVVEKAEPKERERDVVYYIEGSKDTAKAREAVAKRKAFLEGKSVTVTEEEINSLIAAGAPAATPAAKDAKKAPEKKDGKDAKAAENAAPAAGGNGYFTTGAPNVRVRDGALQVGVPVTIDLLDHKVVAQATGGFVKRGEIFVFEPTTMYLGSCPVHRLPFAANYVRNAFVASQPIPDDIKTAWAKLANVSIEGNAVKLTMP